VRGNVISAIKIAKIALSQLLRFRILCSRLIPGYSQQLLGGHPKIQTTHHTTMKHEKAEPSYLCTFRRNRQNQSECWRLESVREEFHYCAISQFLTGTISAKNYVSRFSLFRTFRTLPEQILPGCLKLSTVEKATVAKRIPAAVKGVNWQWLIPHNTARTQRYMLCYTSSRIPWARRRFSLVYLGI